MYNFKHTPVVHLFQWYLCAFLHLDFKKELSTNNFLFLIHLCSWNDCPVSIFKCNRVLFFLKKKKKKPTKKNFMSSEPIYRATSRIRRRYIKVFFFFQTISEFWIFIQALLVINNWYMHKIIELFQSTSKNLMLFNYRYIFHPVNYR